MLVKPITNKQVSLARVIGAGTMNRFLKESLFQYLDKLHRYKKVHSMMTLVRTPLLISKPQKEPRVAGTDVAKSIRII